MTKISQDEFFALSLEEIEGRTGIEAPEGADESEVQGYRERAWKSHKLDVANRDEWGGTEGDSTKPE